MRPSTGWSGPTHQRDAGLAAIKPEPTFASLHADPRWQAFLEKMGLAN